MSSARFGIGQPTVLPVQLALELSERRENPEHQPAAGGRGVDIGALPGQDAKANPAFHQIMDGVDEVTEVTAEAIELPDDESITLAQCPEAGLQTGPIIFLARRLILIEMGALNAGRDQRVALQIEHLRPVRL